MKKKNLILRLVFIILFINCSIVNSSNIEIDDTIFMGKVVEISQENNEVYYIKVNGYIKNCTIYPEEIIGIINNETIFIKSKCELEKVNISNIEKGDCVYIKFNSIMYPSLPPQSIVEEIEVSKIKR